MLRSKQDIQFTLQCHFLPNSIPYYFYHFNFNFYPHVSHFLFALLLCMLSVMIFWHCIKNLQFTLQCHFLPNSILYYFYFYYFNFYPHVSHFLFAPLLCMLSVMIIHHTEEHVVLMGHTFIYMVNEKSNVCGHRKLHHEQ